MRLGKKRCWNAVTSGEKAAFNLTKELMHQRFNAESVELGVLNLPLILRIMKYLIPFGNFVIKNMEKTLIYICSTQKTPKTLNCHRYICVGYLHNQWLHTFSICCIYHYL